MNIAVCVKQIPDSSTPMRLDEKSHNLVRDVKLVMDESDSYGVEMALRLVEADGSGEVTLISMAPRAEVSGLRTALAMGAGRAVLISDDALLGADALSTAKVLAAAIKRLPFDLVIAGTESTDGYTGTTPVQIAELLDLPSISFAKKVEVKDAMVVAERQTEAGYDEVRSPLPALVTVTAGAVEPRYPSFKGIMSAKSKPIEVLSLSDLGIDVSSVRREACGQEILSVEDAAPRGAGRVIEDDGHAHERIIDFLEQLKVL